MGCRIRLGVILPLWVLLNASPAIAQDIPFVFLLQDGWSKTFNNPYVRQEHALTTWASRTTFHHVVNGQKGAVAGNALIHIWSRQVADPYFAPLGSVAGVVTLDFGPFRGHLTVFDTPSGIKTTIGIIGDNGFVSPDVSGVWVYGNGTSVGGGTANDMVVGGVVHFGQPQTIGNYTLSITKYFGVVATDFSPFQGIGQANSQAFAGSFLGAFQGPLRTFSRGDQQWTGIYDEAHVMVTPVAGGYAVLACSMLGDHPSDRYLRRCTLSGTGALSRLTGALINYGWVNLQYDLQLFLHLAP